MNYSTARLSPLRDQRYHEIPRSDEQKMRASRLEERVAHQSALIDRLLAPPGGAPSGANDSPTTHHKENNAASPAEVEAAASPSALRVELTLLQMRAAALEDRVKSTEHTLTRYVARAEDLAQRLHTDGRTTEALTITVKETADEVQANRAAITSLEQRLDHRFSEFDERIVGMIEQRIAVRVEHALESLLQQSRRDADLKYRSIEERLRRLEQDMSDAQQHNAGLITAALRTVQRHVDESLDRAAADTLRKMDAFDADRASMAQDRRHIAAEVARLETVVATAQSDLALLQGRTAELHLRTSHWDEEAKNLNRRLASALRHLRVDRPAAADVSTPAALHPSPSRPTNPNTSVITFDGAPHGVKDEAASRQTTRVAVPVHPNPSPIDDFLSELEAALSIPPSS